MNDSDRRFFSASSLTLAVAAAARWYGVDPERLAYRVRDKRHGFVKAPRGVLIEIDPLAPARAADDRTAPTPRPESEASATDVARRPSGAPRIGGQPRGERTERPRREPRRTERDSESEKWLSPDADSELAAREACTRLLHLAGLALEPEVRRSEERLEVRLAGADEPELERRGLAFLDDLEHLLPRAVHGLCGRMVRVRIEGAGLRAARERELVEIAEAAARRVLAGGAEELIEALGPADRRTVHLALANRAGIATESIGEGHRKRLRIFARPA